jgi:hypothetical protein
MDQRDRDVLRFARSREPEGFSLALRRLALGLLAFVIGISNALPAAAADPVRLVPTAVEATPGRYSPAASSQDGEVRRRGAEIDATVAEALEDMGLEVVPGSPNAPSDGNLLELAQGGWAFAPRLELRAEGALVRMVAVSPGSRVLLVREEDLDESELGALSVRTVVMVRDIVESGRGRHVERPKPVQKSRVHGTPPAPRSSGTPVLALNATLYGGYLGFALQQASSSENARLVYPLMAIGAGLGLGASLLVADEWDIGEGDAWYLAAGIYWPGASGFLIAESYGTTLGDRYLYGLVGATTGLGLGTIAVANKITEVAIEGSSDTTPTRGMGYGTGVGVLAAGLVATQVDISASRMLFVDLSVSLGGLGGAALASPLLAPEEPDPTRTRLWLGAVAAGAIAGGVIGWYLTDDDGNRRTALHILPYATHSVSADGDSVEAGVTGTF